MVVSSTLETMAPDIAEVQHDPVAQKLQQVIASVWLRYFAAVNPIAKKRLEDFLRKNLDANSDIRTEVVAVIVSARDAIERKFGSTAIQRSTTNCMQTAPRIGDAIAADIMKNPKIRSLLKRKGWGAIEEKVAEPPAENPLTLEEEKYLQEVVLVHMRTMLSNMKERTLTRILYDQTYAYKDFPSRISHMCADNEFNMNGQARSVARALEIALREGRAMLFDYDDESLQRLSFMTFGGKKLSPAQVEILIAHPEVQKACEAITRMQMAAKEQKKKKDTRQKSHKTQGATNGALHAKTEGGIPKNDNPPVPKSPINTLVLERLEEMLEAIDADAALDDEDGKLVLGSDEPSDEELDRRIQKKISPQTKISREKPAKKAPAQLFDGDDAETADGNKEPTLAELQEIERLLKSSGEL